MNARCPILFMAIVATSLLLSTIGGNGTALHMERIKQRSDRPLSCSSYDTLGRY
jgi:hypothetical protein